jgi:urea transporter
MILYDIQSQINNRHGYIDKMDESELEDGRYEIFLKHTMISGILQVILMIINSIATFFAETDATASFLLNVV